MNDFNYSDERFADLQMLRYRLKGFENLTFKQKLLIYCLAKASLYGRDITFDQNGKYNLRIRKTLETVYERYNVSRNQNHFKALETYLKRVWFSSGIYHHYGCEKFLPEFSETFLRSEITKIDEHFLPLKEKETKEIFVEEICRIIFNPNFLAKRVNQADGEDLVVTSACNFYEQVTQKEVESFYAKKKETFSIKHPDRADTQPSWGLNSKLVRRDNQLEELIWKE